MNSRIPSQQEYENREAREFQRQLSEAEKNPDKRADAERFREALASDPALVAERVGWLIAGNYGYGAMQAAKRVLGQKRMNRAAWLVQVTGAVEWSVPPRLVAAAWKKLSGPQKEALVRAVEREVRLSEEE